MTLERIPVPAGMIPVLMLVVLVVPACSQDPTAELRQRAEQGDTEAQYDLGLMYANGEGVARDDEQAVRWFRLAAEQGDADAQFNLSFMYLNGEGVPQDYEEAIRWFRAAAEQGLAPAQFYLGFMYSDGKGVPRDDQEAALWYGAAAEQGLATAQFYLGFMYDSGRGVPRDEIQAHMWLSLATSSLTGDLREEAVRGRDRVAEKMHPAEIVEAERLVRRWKTQSSRSQ